MCSGNDVVVTSAVDFALVVKGPEEVQEMREECKGKLDM